MYLDKLPLNSKAIIANIATLDLNQTSKRKLLSMGITPNTELQLIRRAPLGSGLELKIRGTTLCIRQSLAKLIEVEVLND